MDEIMVFSDGVQSTTDAGMTDHCASSVVGNGNFVGNNDQFNLTTNTFENGPNLPHQFFPDQNPHNDINNSCLSMIESIGPSSAPSITINGGGFMNSDTNTANPVIPVDINNSSQQHQQQQPAGTSFSGMMAQQTVAPAANSSSEMANSFHLSSASTAIKVHPGHLASNATSHTFPFSAIAELIDNAYDPGCEASNLSIENGISRGIHTIEFKDDGRGLDRSGLTGMLDLGFSRKKMTEGNKAYDAIGQFGNGFKSGSMRIGKDALVLTKEQKTKEGGGTMSVGMLSQTYLDSIKADTVYVPKVTWWQDTEELVDQDDSHALAAILFYSQIFKTENELLDALRKAPGFQRDDNKQTREGTRIIIYNLNPEELLFVHPNFRQGNATRGDILWNAQKETESAHKISLRLYCSLLFRVPRVRIEIMHDPVEAVPEFACRNWRYRYQDTYQRMNKDSQGNNAMNQKDKLWLKFGLELSTREFGCILYHKNRLIKAYEKIGGQKSGAGGFSNSMLMTEVNYLDVVHNKQDFYQNAAYSTFMQAIEMKLKDYVKKVCPEMVREEAGGGNLIDFNNGKALHQCRDCSKWRRIPEEHKIRLMRAKQKWTCDMNPDLDYNSCEIPEEGFIPGEQEMEKYRQIKRRADEAARLRNQNAGKLIKKDHVPAYRRDGGVANIQRGRDLTPLDFQDPNYDPNEDPDYYPRRAGIGDNRSPFSGSKRPRKPSLAMLDASASSSSPSSATKYDQQSDENDSDIEILDEVSSSSETPAAGNSRKRIKMEIKQEAEDRKMNAYQCRLCGTKRYDTRSDIPPGRFTCAFGGFPCVTPQLEFDEPTSSSTNNIPSNAEGSGGKIAELQRAHQRELAELNEKHAQELKNEKMKLLEYQEMEQELQDDLKSKLASKRAENAQLKAKIEFLESNVMSLYKKESSSESSSTSTSPSKEK